MRTNYPDLAERRVVHETVRRMINTLVTDLIGSDRTKYPDACTAEAVDDVRAAPPIVAFSAEMHELNRELKAFLRTHLYRHYRVMRMTAKARRIIGDLFDAFL